MSGTTDVLSSSHPVALFRGTFATLGPGQDMHLDRLYVPDVIFIDPFGRVDGLDALRRHFDHMNANLISGHTAYGEELLDAGSAFLTWTLHLRPRRFGRPVIFQGVSHLRFTDRVEYQRDYFDAGSLYEAVPGLGAVIRQIKKRI